MVVYNSPFSRRDDDPLFQTPWGSEQSSGMSANEKLRNFMEEMFENPPSPQGLIPASTATDTDTTSVGELQSRLSELRARIASDPEISQQDFLSASGALSAAAAGAPQESNWLEKALGAVGGAAMTAFDYTLVKPARAAQAGIAQVGLAIEELVSGDALDTVTSGPSAVGGVQAQQDTSTLEQIGVLQKGEDTGYGFFDLFNDPEFQLTVPNLRDAFEVNTGFAPVDWVGNQIGLRALDIAAEAGLQIGTDPWSYLTFGTTAWMGSAGRASLAARLLQPDAKKILQALPDSKILNNIDDVYRRGEFALTVAERRALANAGIMGRGGVQFLGKYTVPLTERLAQGVGSTLAGVRSGGARALGRVGEGLSRLYTPETRYELIPLARKAVSKEEGVRRVQLWAASQAARGEYARLSGIWGSRYRDLIERLTGSEARFNIGDAIEGTIDRASLSVEDQLLVDELQAAFATIKDEYNAAVTKYVREFDLEPAYVRQIAELQDVNDYFFHTLTPDALRWVMKGDAGDSLRAGAARTLSTAAEDMRSGGGPILGRKLKAGEEFLGRKLQTGSIDEINAISREELKFDWFNTDASGVLVSYIQSVSRQAKRMAFVSRLFDYGDDTIRPVLSQVIPDQQLLRDAEKALKVFDDEIARLTRILAGQQSGPTRDTKKVLNRVANLAAKISADGVRAMENQEEKMLRALTRLREVEAEVAAMRDAASTAEDNIRQGYETVLDQIRLRLQTIEDAISNGEGAKAVAYEALLKEHTKLFPRRTNRPTTVKGLADEISGENQKRFGKKIKALETSQSRAQRKATKAGQQAVDEAARLEQLETAAQDVSVRLAALRAMDEIDYDSEIFPDGLMYTTEEMILQAPVGGTVDFYPTTEGLDSPIVAIPAPAKLQTYDLTADAEAVGNLLGDAGRPFGLYFADPEGLGDSALGDAFINEYERLLRSPRGTEPATDVPDEIKGLLRVLTGWGWQEEADPTVAATYMQMIADELSAIHIARGFGDDIEPNYLAETLINDALQLAVTAGQGAGGRAVAIVPDLYFGGTKFIGDAAEIGRVYTGQVDDTFAGIVEGSAKWDDLVPEYVAAPEPAATVTAPAAPAAPEPTPAQPAGAAPPWSPDDSVTTSLGVVPKEINDEWEQIVALFPPDLQDQVRYLSRFAQYGPTYSRGVDETLRTAARFVNEPQSVREYLQQAEQSAHKAISGETLALPAAGEPNPFVSLPWNKRVAGTGGGVSFAGPSYELSQQVIGGKGTFVRRSGRAPELNNLFNRGARPVSPEQMEEAIQQLADITALDEKAEMLSKVFNTPTGSRNDFTNAIEDQFTDEVEFFIGAAAAGVTGGDNAQTMRGWRDMWIGLRDPDEVVEQFGPFIEGAYDSIQRGNRYGLDDTQVEQLTEGYNTVSAGQSTAPAPRYPEPVPEPVGGTAGPSAMEQRFGRQLEVIDEEAAFAPQREELQTRLSELAGEQEFQSGKAAQVGRQIGGQRAAATRQQRKVDDLRAAAGNRKPVELDGDTMSIRDAKGLRKEEARKLDFTLKRMDAEIAADPAVKRYKNKSTEEKLRKATVTFDQEYALSEQHEEWVATTGRMLDEDIETIDQLIADMPATSPSGMTASKWMRRVRDLDYALQSDDLLLQDKRLRNAWEQSTKAMFAAEADLAMLESQRVVAQKVADDIANKLVGSKVAKDILNGWVELEGLGVQIPKELRDEMLTGLRRIADPAEFNKAMKWYLQYQRFFKSYAIATPGFTIRNAMTAIFNNMVAGVNWDDTRKALKFAKDYRRRGLDYALNQITDPAERALYDEAYSAVARSGGGQAVDELLPLVKGQGNRLYNNGYTRFHQRNNEAIEIAFRMGMALDAARKGWVLDQNAARIARYHFDYSDLSRLDRVAKTFIPFWTFASRNIQLQAINMFVRPKWYSRYETLRRSDADNDTSMFPLWLRERDPLVIGENRVIDLDLPQVDMEQKFQQLLSPQRLASMTNPLLRVTLEALTGESTAFDYPYSTQARQLGITDLPSAAIAALPTLAFGGSLSRGEGATGLQAGEFVQQLGPNLLPPLQQIQRLVKPIMGAAGASEEAQTLFGGAPRYSERDVATTLGGFTGLPVRQITQQDINNEVRRREFLMERLAREARKN